MVAIAQVCESFAYGTAKSICQLCSFLPADDRVTVFYGQRQGTDLELLNLPENVQWCPLPGQGKRMHLTNLRFLNQRLSEGFDVVHGHSSFGGMYAKLVGPHHGLPTLYSPRGYSFLRGDLSASSRRIYRLLERATARRCTTVACGPHEHHLTQRLGGRSVCINNGYEVSEPQPVEELDGSILGVGRICHQKGFDLFAALARRIPDRQFVWVGDVQHGSLDDWTEPLPNLTVHAYMPHQDLIQRIRSASFVLLPSRWEGLSRFLIESVCLSKVLVTSRFPANLDCLDGAAGGDTFRNGFACNSVDEYETAVRKLSDDPALISSMQNASYKFAKQNFDIQKIANQWQDLYHSFAQNR